MAKSKVYVLDSLDAVYEAQVEKAGIVEREWQDYCKSHLENLKRICNQIVSPSDYCKHELERWEEPEPADALAETAFSADSEEGN